MKSKLLILLCLFLWLVPVVAQGEEPPTSPETCDEACLLDPIEPTECVEYCEGLEEPGSEPGGEPPPEPPPEEPPEEPPSFPE